MPIQTPICDFNLNAFDFKLKSVENTLLSLNDIKGENGTLIMFICNHCPYVKAIIKDLVKDCENLKDLELQYRGRLRELKNLVPVRSGESDLLVAMKQIAKTGKGPDNQTPSAGCGIKWKQ